MSTASVKHSVLTTNCSFQKGVVATGAQIKESAMACGQVVRDIIPEGPNHIYIAYLPQAHILELSIEMFLFIGGVKIGYASPFTLNESVRTYGCLFNAAKSYKSFSL